MARKINESNNYGMTITDDGTDTGKVIGNMSASLNTGNQAIGINVSLVPAATLLTQKVEIPADSVIQQQVTDFITQVRRLAATSGLTAFGIAE